MAIWLNEADGEKLGGGRRKEGAFLVIFKSIKLWPFRLRKREGACKGLAGIPKTRERGVFFFVVRSSSQLAEAYN